MRTIRLHDPLQQRAGVRRLEWGSSEWAAESCLADWSTLERQWLDPEPASRPAVELPGWLRQFGEHMLGALRIVLLVSIAGAGTWGLLHALLPV